MKKDKKKIVDPKPTKKEKKMFVDLANRPDPKPAIKEN